MVLKSASRGVQWIEPDLSRQLAVIWKIAEEARDTEATRSAAKPAASADGEVDLDVEDPDEIAPGIKTKSTSEAETDGLNITSVYVGHGGVGQNVGQVRRAG